MKIKSPLIVAREEGAHSRVPGIPMQYLNLPRSSKYKNPRLDSPTKGYNVHIGPSYSGFCSCRRLVTYIRFPVLKQIFSILEKTNHYKKEG